MDEVLNATVSIHTLIEQFQYFIKVTHVHLFISLNQRLSEVIITCVYESLYASIMNKIYEQPFQMQINTLN